jgi:hypothetical protein
MDERMFDALVVGLAVGGRSRGLSGASLCTALHAFGDHGVCSVRRMRASASPDD